MKQTIKKISSAIVLIGIFAVAITSCQKEQPSGAKPSTGYEDGLTSLSDPNSNPPLSLCSTIPDILNVPEGNRLALQTFARGVQIYEVKRSDADPNVISWVNTAPSATLYTNPNFTNEVIMHFAGPTWEFTKGPEKGEKVVAKKLQGVTQDDSAIQWLLLKAVDSLSTAGNKITFIQRVCTVGGLAPTTGADEQHLGQIVRIPYTASYLLYTKSFR